MARLAAVEVMMVDVTAVASMGLEEAEMVEEAQAAASWEVVATAEVM